jgi:hypothetical protein
MEDIVSDTIRGDYLWDRSGEPDETVLHLETVLVEYRRPDMPRHDGESDQEEPPVDASGI